MPIERGAIQSLELGSAPGTPASGSRLLYPKAGGWFTKDSSGNEVRVLASGADITALAAVTTPTGALEIPVNAAGTAEKLTLSQVNAYCEPISAASITPQTGFATDTYIAGSSPVGWDHTRLQAGSFYRIKAYMTKTAASTATAVFTLRLGTAGTTADAAICTFTFAGAQTAATDKGFLEILANFHSVGSGTAAVLEGTLFLMHNSGTGFLGSGTIFMQPLNVTSAGFDSTTPTHIGVSLNAGASASWTLTTVQADVLNLL